MSTEPFPRIQIARLEGRSQSLRLRQALFHSLHAALTSSESAIKQAIVADTGNSDADIALEYSLVLSELRTQYESLDLKTEVTIAHSLENPTGTTNVGIVYVIPEQRNLFYSILSPLCAALAAGNCVILELPPTLSQVSSTLRKLLPDALDADVFAISNSRPPDSFLSQCLVVSQLDDDRKNFSVAAGCLPSRPSALAVAVIDRTANISNAARSVALSRRLLQGQSHYAPDIVLVSEWVADEMLAHLVREVATPLVKGERTSPPANGPSKKPTPYSRHQALKEFDGKDGCKVVVSGEHGSIVEITSRDQGLLHHKIEGPVTVLHRVSSLDDAIDVSNGLGLPLDALYIFATPEEAIYVSRFVDTRISCMNHIPLELLIGPSAPVHPTAPTTATPRYASAMFRRPQPRSATASDLSKTILLEDSKASTRASIQDQLSSWSRAAARPLRPTGQGDGKALGFFDAAFLLAGGTVLSVAATSIFLTVRYLRRR
ncbi:hypothetical protein PV04_10392 [Phialophora macrospora]|uniref:Aldehyde dehydrogenase domain-containing protein n=1 Tax=Phialophora macrospora TaxID=1851006 RepID=A0A0D2FQC5_9EURO|nr:hypothetical protein PV04_10392 [Phialophora macrospora]